MRSTPRSGWSKAPQGRVAYVDGRYLPHAAASVHIEDRGLQFGDAVYEVLRLTGGRLFDMEEHLDRLEFSTREIGLVLPMGRAALGHVVREVVRRSRLSDGLVYLQLTRGAARRAHPIARSGPRPTLILTVHPADVATLGAQRRNGVAAITAPDIRWGRPDIKTTQLLANSMAKTQAREAGAYEAWLVDAEGLVTEGTSTTAWIVDAAGRIITRPLSNRILPGVTRRVILEALAEAQLAVDERGFTVSDAAKASEAFISSATGIVPIVKIDGKPVGTGEPGPVTRRVQELYEALAAKRSRQA